MLKVMTVLGTRPEIIRLSVILKEMDKYFDHKICFTNQSFDYEMSQIFFDELKLRKPDYILDVKSDTVGEQIGKILTQTEQVMLKEKPNAILILGDTNSALSCIVAKRLKIIVFHMEAGNRCFDNRVPEEINRRIVDHTADINLAYTEHARRNLLAEGLPTQNIFVTGSPLVEVYNHYKEQIQNSNILQKLVLKKDKFILASIHRGENLGDINILKSLISALVSISNLYNKPLIFPAHPHTQQILDNLQIDCGDIIFLKPMGMFDYISLQKNAYITLSDSGTIHEDSAILNIPTLNIRESNERQEVYDTGNLIMTGLELENILKSVEIIRKQYENGIKPDNPYGESLCSYKVIRLIQGLTKIMRKRLYYE